MATQETPSELLEQEVKSTTTITTTATATRVPSAHSKQSCSNQKAPEISLDEEYLTSSFHRHEQVIALQREALRDLSPSQWPLDMDPSLRQEMAWEALRRQPAPSREVLAGLQLDDPQEVYRRPPSAPRRMNTSSDVFEELRPEGAGEEPFSEPVSARLMSVLCSQSPGRCSSPLPVRSTTPLPGRSSSPPAGRSSSQYSYLSTTESSCSTCTSLKRSPSSDSQTHAAQIVPAQAFLAESFCADNPNISIISTIFLSPASTQNSASHSSQKTSHSRIVQKSRNNFSNYKKIFSRCFRGTKCCSKKSLSAKPSPCTSSSLVS